ncbi:flavin reductase family protein [Streptomyces sp. NPDC059169]|uniref:flavin reductase family protein n=1 Tax=unclassified Streptomyces TaxID=2593676 RepID=UPI0036C157C0
MGPEAFRDFFGAVPTAVAVVTTVDHDDNPLGFTCGALCPVSLDPPLLPVSVDERSRTLPAVLDSGIFALRLLAAGGGEELARGARRPGRLGEPHLSSRGRREPYDHPCRDAGNGPMGLRADLVHANSHRAAFAGAGASPTPPGGPRAKATGTVRTCPAPCPSHPAPRRQEPAVALPGSRSPITPMRKPSHG